MSPPAWSQPAEAPADRLPPERTYSKAPFVHNIPLLDAQGNVIRSPKPDDPPDARPGPFSMATTCGKCHSDYDVIARGWHFNFSRADAPHGRPGEPWLLSDAQTRTQLPLSYRGWKGTFHPYDIGMNDFNFARHFARHHPGGGAMAESEDLRFKMSGPLAIDCLICHTSDRRHDPVVRAQAISEDQNFEQAALLAAYVGQVQGTAARLKDDFDPSGRDARRAPRVTYDAGRFDEKDRVLFNVSRRIPNERCYICHTSIDVGAGGAENEGLEGRWRHAGDVHLVNGMQCVDCHRNGADHMIVRGYEGEYDVRVRALGEEKVDKSITTLSCRGCHYGTDSTAGGIGAAPRPEYRGLPTLHFDKLTCTACHSGPSPTAAATAVQTSMAHKLGLPRHHTTDAAAPQIQQPVFLRVDSSGSVTGDEHAALAPHRMVYPSFWGRMTGQTITPIQPQYVLAAGTGDILGEAPDAKHFAAHEPLSTEQVVQVLAKLAAAAPPDVAAADVVTARQPKAGATTAAGAPATSQVTTSATTVPATNAAPTTGASAEPPAKTIATPAPVPAWAAGEPVFVTGGKVYKRNAEGKGLESFAHSAAEPYAWALGHDVRPAQQSLGARGCVECHASGAPIFNSNVSSAALLSGAVETSPMHDLNNQPMGALGAFAATYPLRPLLIIVGYVCAAVLALVLLSCATSAIGALRVPAEHPSGLNTGKRES